MIRILSLGALFLSLNAMALTNEEGQKLAESSLKDLVVDSAKHYCVAGSMTCRSLFLLKDKNSGSQSKVFRITFYSSERQVAGSEIYVPVPGAIDQYYRLVDTTFDGTVNISRADEVQAVERTASELRIKNLFMPKLGTSQFIISDLVFQNSIAKLEGTLKDSKDPEFAQPIKIDYLEVQTN